MLMRVFNIFSFRFLLKISIYLLNSTTVSPLFGSLAAAHGDGQMGRPHMYRAAEATMIELTLHSM